MSIVLTPHKLNRNSLSNLVIPGNPGNERLSLEKNAWQRGANSKRRVPSGRASCPAESVRGHSVDPKAVVWIWQEKPSGNLYWIETMKTTAFLVETVGLVLKKKGSGLFYIFY